MGTPPANTVKLRSFKHEAGGVKVVVNFPGLETSQVWPSRVTMVCEPIVGIAVIFSLKGVGIGFKPGC